MTSAKEAPSTMWTARETARALRGEKATIAREWQTEAQTHLWHLNKALLTRKGPAMRLADMTLTALAEYHQFRHDSLPTKSVPPQEEGRPLPQEVPADPSGSLASALPSYLHQSASGAIAAPASLAQSEIIERLTLTCAEEWTTLSISWADTRSLIELLTTSTQRALLQRGADADALALCNGFFAMITAQAADRRITQLDQQLAAKREESDVAQHLASRFLANASHELRTPLTAVLGFAELLLEETYGELTSEQRTAISHIESSAQNLLEVINNVLDLLRIRSGKLALQYRPVVLIPLLHNIYDILVPLSTRKSVSFSMELPDDLGVIEADENILRHIVYHLLASALRATPAEGRVTLRAERDASSVSIITQDTALHLPPEAIAIMQDPFPRLENSPARGYEGWEVGLPLVRRYVELHDGTLELVSNPGQGTTFRIILPVTRPPAKPAST